MATLLEELSTADLFDADRGPEQGAHLCLVYDAIDEKLETATRFLCTGFDRDERGVYIADELKPDDIRLALHERGVDVPEFERRGRLAIDDGSGTYAAESEFESARMIADFDGMVTDALSDGWSGLRVAGEMTWVLAEHGPDRATLREYEAELNNFIPTRPLLGLCQYNRARFPPEVIRDVIATHPLVAVDGLICDNGYYVPPDEVLNPATSREVDRLLANIVSHASASLAMREAIEREHKAAEQLRHLDEMKNTFLEAVSHEVRTPLTALLGYAETLERTFDALPEEISKHLVERVHVNAIRLDRLLGDLLDLNRLLRGVIRPQIAATDLTRLVADVVAHADLRGRALNTDVEPIIAEIDGPKVERIIENLVNNAARHTPEDAAIWLSVRRTDEGIRIEVDDAGQGISDSEKERIFAPFEHGEGGRSHNPGSGLGLSLVSRFAAIHGGRAWVEDRSGGGASFRVVIPEGEHVGH